MEFAHDLSTHFSHDIITLGELQELVSLEQFKNTPSDRVVTYITELKASKASDAAKLVDGFVLTHQNFMAADGSSESIVTKQNKRNKMQKNYKLNKYIKIMK